MTSTRRNTERGGRAILMVQVVGFVSEKGGVGKTTAVYHIGVSLKRDHGAKVLLLDTDYQRGGLACRLIPEMLEDFRDGKVVDTTLHVVYRSLYAESEFPQLTVRGTNVGLDLVPADPRLNAISVDKLPAPRNIRQSNELLLRHLMLIDEVLTPLADDYDFVLIDSHPDLHDLEKAVIAASDHLVSPVKLDQQSAVAVASTQQAMNDVNDDIQTALTHAETNRAYSPTSFLGAVGMMCREYGAALKYSEQLIYNRLYRTTGVLRSYVTEGDGLRRAAQASRPVYDIAGTNAQRQSEQFRAVTNEILARIANDGH